MTQAPELGRTTTEQKASLLKSALVVELGDRVSVAACGGLLAQLGATVILVEPPSPRANHKWSNRALSAAGKLSLVVDQNGPEDKRLLADLLKVADVVLISSDVANVDLDVWQSNRPKHQIICDITAFGHAGPLTGLGLSEALVQAYVGVADTTGAPDGPPAVVGTPVLEMGTAAYAASAVVAALRVRRQHGFGQRIDMALYDFGVNALINFIPLDIVGRSPTRSGNRHPVQTPWNSYQAKDGWILICAPTNDLWKRICETIGKPDLASDPRFTNSQSRLDNFKEMDKFIGAWVAERGIAECEAHLVKAVIPSGPIVDLDKLAEEPNLAHRRMVRQLNDPVSGGMVQVPASPLRAEPIGGLAPESIPAANADREAIQSLIQQAAQMSSADAVSGDQVTAVRPLSGVRIIEIGQHTVAPQATRNMAALGADVIKIEAPNGDPVRLLAPLRDGLSYVFALSNTDKRGLVLDMRRPEDMAVLHQLLSTADVLIENLKPGSLAKLGLGTDVLRQKFPRLIYCSINGFGSDSAYPGRPALDSVVQGMSGIMSTTVANGIPTKSGISISDMLGGQFGLLGLLAAIEYKDRTGEAVHFDLTMHDASVWATQMLWNGASSASASCRMVKAADGYVACEGDASAVPAHAAAMSRADLVAVLSKAGHGAAPVLTVGEVMCHPHVAARELMLDRPSPDGYMWPALACPLRLRSTPPKVGHAMPKLGVLDPALARELGLDPETTAERTQQVRKLEKTPAA